MDFSIKPITPESKLKVLGFMKKNFFKDEPLNNSVKLIDAKDTTCIELEEYSMSSLDENLSLMAVSSSGMIVGVIINGKTIKNILIIIILFFYLETSGFSKNFI